MLAKNKLIKAITSDSDLWELSKQLDLDINGIYDIRDSYKLNTSGTYIILMRSTDDVGHWVCVCDNQYFDSMGCPPSSKIKVTQYSDIQYQGSRNDYCGIYCLLFIYSVQKHRPDLLQGFTNLDTDISYD